MAVRRCLPSGACQWVRVWNLPVRIVHWSMVACYVIAWSTRSSRYLDIHVFAGYTLGGLVGFRLVWGVIGGPYARFRDFRFGWRQVLGHLRTVLRGEAEPFIGHNPAGSVIIYLLLAFSAVVAVTGLLTLGAEERQGPLAGVASFAWGEWFHGLHEGLAWFTLVIVSVHLAGVAVESVLLRENLVAPMISGFKRSVTAAVSVPPRRGTGAVLLLAIALFGAYWFGGYLTASADDPYRPFTGPALAQDSAWMEECGGCHLAYHPSLLPERSWVMLLRQQASHFGEDLFLDAETLSRLEHFAVANAAERAATEAAWKMNRTIPGAEIPLRITGTPYWKQKHQGLPESVWRHESVGGRSHCEACHLDAEAGTFEDAAMRLPNGF